MTGRMECPCVIKHILWCLQAVSQNAVLTQRLANYIQEVKSSHTHSFRDSLWLPSAAKVELSSCDRDHKAHKTENVCFF